MKAPGKNLLLSKNVPVYIPYSYTGMGVQLELWAWVFNAVQVSLQSSNKK